MKSPYCVTVKLRRLPPPPRIEKTPPTTPPPRIDKTRPTTPPRIEKLRRLPPPRIDKTPPTTPPLQFSNPPHWFQTQIPPCSPTGDFIPREVPRLTPAQFQSLPNLKLSHFSH